MKDTRARVGPRFWNVTQALESVTQVISKVFTFIFLFFFLAVSSEDSSDVVSIRRMKLKIQKHTKLHFAWLY